MIGALPVANAASSDWAMESRLWRMLRGTSMMRSVDQHKVLRYHVRGRIELVVTDQSTVAAAVAAKLPQLRDPYHFARYMCAIAVTRAMAPQEVVVSASVPFRDKVIKAARRLSDSTGSIRDLSVSQDERRGSWLLVVCTVPRKDVVVSSMPVHDLMAEAELGVAKTLVESGVTGSNVVQLLDLAGRDDALIANVTVLKDLITWSGSSEMQSQLAVVIPAVSDRDTTVIAGSFLSAKHKWRLAGDAFARCLELDHNNPVCENGLRSADAEEQKRKRICVANLFSAIQKRPAFCR